MLPAIRGEEHLYPVPKFDLKPRDIKSFSNELSGFHEQFHDCFMRSESREHFLNYMAGQFSDIERKSIEPIALAIENCNVRSLQRFVSDAPWDDDKIGCKYRNLVSEDLGSPEGALIFDESGFVKKGDESIGVARQYCGTIGKVDNCQVGVFAGYVSEYGYALVDKRLFLPEKWFTEAYRERRLKCKLPKETVFKTKPELATEMLRSLHSENALPFKYILADSLYGMSPEFIEAAEALPDTTYLVQVAKNTQVWLKRPMTVTQTYRWGGESRTKTVLVDTHSKPITVGDLAHNINNYFWYRRKVSEGTKGPIVYEFTRRQVVLSAEGLPQKTVWLLVRRTLGANREYSYFLSNAQPSIRFSTLIWLSGLRWAIEQCFEEAKTELGMDHYEVRKYMGWHHHILTCMMAHFFLWHLKIRMGKKSAFHYAVAA
jgi:SRSO17 transposase